jgi:hypothetical protein
VRFRPPHFPQHRTRTQRTRTVCLSPAVIRRPRDVVSVREIALSFSPLPSPCPRCGRDHKPNGLIRLTGAETISTDSEKEQHVSRDHKLTGCSLTCSWLSFPTRLHFSLPLARSSASQLLVVFSSPVWPPAFLLPPPPPPTPPIPLIVPNTLIPSASRHAPISPKHVQFQAPRPYYYPYPPRPSTHKPCAVEGCD